MRALYLFLAVAGFVSFSAQNLVDQDLWGHLAFGRATWISGWVVTSDPYSYVPTRPWINHEWLSEVTMYLVLALAGGVGLVVLKGVAGALLAVCVGVAARAREASATAVVGVSALALLGMSWGVHVRPYVFTYLFFAATIALLERYRTGHRASGWLLVPLIAVWANCHAAFVVGLGVIGMYLFAMEERRNELLAILAAALAATLVNPYGPRYWPFVLEAVTMNRPYITEWRALPWDTVQFWEYKLLLLATVAAIVARRRFTRAEVVAYALLAITAWMAARHYRHVPLFLIAAAAYLPAMLPRREIRFVPQAAAVAALALLIATLPRLTQGLVIPLAGNPAGYLFPARSLEVMRQNDLLGDTLCFFDWGEFIIWELWPANKVSFDGRLETVYEKPIIDANLALTRGQPEGLAFVKSHPPSVALLAPRATALLKATWGSESVTRGWLPIYAEGEATLLVPDTPENRARKWRLPDDPGGTAISLDAWLQAHPFESRPVPAI